MTCKCGLQTPAIMSNDMYKMEGGILEELPKEAIRFNNGKAPYEFLPLSSLCL